MSKSKPKEVPVSKPEYQVPSLVELGGAVAEVDEGLAAFNEAMGDVELPEAPGMPLIRIDHKAGVFDLSGSPEEVIEGYVIHYFQTRAWWEKRPEGGKGKPPDCSSSDMLRPSFASPQKQAEACYECQLSTWGSGPQGTGQACKVQTWVFLLNPAFGSPPVRALLLPPSSIRDFIGTQFDSGYLGRAREFHPPGKPRAEKYPRVWSRWTLDKGGDLHYIAHAEPVAVCYDKAEGAALGRLRAEFVPLMEALRGRAAAMGEE